MIAADAAADDENLIVVEFLAIEHDAGSVVCALFDAFSRNARGGFGPPDFEDASFDHVGEITTRKTMLSVQGLSKRFVDRLAVDDLGIEVEPGTIFGLLGPNGAGKSTTINCIAGLLRPDARVSG